MGKNIKEILIMTYKKKIRFAIFSVIVITIGIVIAVFIGYRKIFNTQDRLLSVIEDNANISIGKVHHISTRNGIKEWSLEARTAKVVNSEKKILLEEIDAIFFMKDGKKVYLTSEHGVLKTDTNDIECTGNVVVRFETYRLETATMNYDHSKRTIFSRVPVNISSKLSDLTADTMSFDLDTKKAFFNGNVKGYFQ